MRRVVIGIAAVMLLAGCSAPSALAADLSAELRASTGTLVLASLGSVDGTDFLVICPYETEGSVSERLGFEWTDAPDYSRRDDRQAIAIIRDDRVVSSAELARDDADFCATGTWDVLPVDTELLVDASADPVRVSVRN